MLVVLTKSGLALTSRVYSSGAVSETTDAKAKGEGFIEAIPRRYVQDYTRRWDHRH
jgi:hypothetical protein